MKLFFQKQLILARRITAPHFSFSERLRSVVLEERDETSDDDSSLSPALSPVLSPALTAISCLTSLSASAACLPCLSLCDGVNIPQLSLDPTASPSAEVVSGRKRKAHSKAQSKRNKRLKRQKEKEKHGAVGYKPPHSVQIKHVLESNPVSTDGDIEQKQVSAGAYVGWRQETKATAAHKLAELTGPKSSHQFEVIRWNGKETIPLVEEGDRVVAVLLGNPKNELDWDKAQKRVAAKLEAERKECSFSQSQLKHRRGHFGALAVGTSHGGGQREPGNLVHDSANFNALERLRKDPDVARFACHASAGFATWAPRLYQHYADYRQRLLARMSWLLFGIMGSIWATVTFNFGPRTVSFPHTDYGNIPYRWCSITAFGRYKHKKGGHLVLWDLGLVIEFPAGSTILLPSGVYRHSNTCVAKNERRYSMAQYTPGGLFRWVDNCFMTDEKFRETRSAAAVIAQREHRWEKGLSLFSTIEELRQC